jgi:predicted nucleic acid-binding protein
VKRILIDTSFYVAFKKGEKSSVDTVRKAAEIGFSTVVIGELLAGFRCANRVADNYRELEQFLDSSRVAVLSVDEETAEYYARIFQELREKGKPVPTNDLWVAATALQHGFALATYDVHFSAISGIITTEL